MALPATLKNFKNFQARGSGLETNTLELGR
jgi:hypothetical protein